MNFLVMAPVAKHKELLREEKWWLTDVGHSSWRQMICAHHAAHNLFEGQIGGSNQTTTSVRLLHTARSNRFFFRTINIAYVFPTVVTLSNHVYCWRMITRGNITFHDVIGLSSRLLVPILAIWQITTGSYFEISRQLTGHVYSSAIEILKSKVSANHNISQTELIK